MMQSPILSNGKKIRKIVMLPEQKKLFDAPLSPEKKEHEKKTKNQEVTNLSILLNMSISHNQTHYERQTTACVFHPSFHRSSHFS